ncbi:MAG: hypothetical protein J1F05_01320 [Muribaculaceae bacterium]|nr:hypothetical protein [Muribaculaceae bacterium]
MNKKAIICALLLNCWSAIIAKNDDNQSQLRLNPDIEVAIESDTNYSNYPFLNLAKNKIELNGDDWSGLVKKYKGACSGDSIFTIVYLGDSHVQADLGGAVLRRRIAEKTHGAGRGIIIPYKLAATNQPLDYTFATDCKYASSKLLKQPWNTEMPFTGIGIKPMDSNYSFSLNSSIPFNRLRLFYIGSQPQVLSVMSKAAELDYSVSHLDNYCYVSLAGTVDAITLSCQGDNNTTFGGIELLADSCGSIVHSIGNNGATYGAYSRINNFAKELSSLQSDIIIVALGTNEAFGNSNKDTLYCEIDNLITDIRTHNPYAHIIMVSPTECFKKVYRYVKNKNGRRRRVRNTVVNVKTHQVRNIIMSYAKEHNIAYYDHFAVAGGEGSAKKMQNSKVLNKDGVHFTSAGYFLWGNLLADALISELNSFGN